MKRAHGWCMAGLLLAATATACRPRPIFELFNNSGQVIVVRAQQLGVVTLAPGDAHRFYYEKVFHVRSGDVEHGYRVPPDLFGERSPEWVEVRPIGRYIIKLQFEKDVVIHILPARATGVTTPVPSGERQGFPLRPLQDTARGAEQQSPDDRQDDDGSGRTVRGA